MLEFLDLDFHTSLHQANKLCTMNNIITHDQKEGGKVKRQLLPWGIRKTMLRRKLEISLSTGVYARICTFRVVSKHPPVLLT